MQAAYNAIHILACSSSSSSSDQVILSGVLGAVSFETFDTNSGVRSSPGLERFYQRHDADVDCDDGVHPRGGTSKMNQSPSTQLTILVVDVDSALLRQSSHQTLILRKCCQSGCCRLHPHQCSDDIEYVCQSQQAKTPERSAAD
jgi:hypothetical protein